MAVSLSHISSGLNALQSTNIVDSNMAFINSLLGGVGGGIGYVGAHRALAYIKAKKDELFKPQHISDDVAEDEKLWKKLSYTNLKKKTYYMNIENELDIFLVNRAIMCGIVSVSIMPSMFHPIFALVNGIIAGMLFIYSLTIYRNMDLYDCMCVSQVHGLFAFYSMISICFFHKEEGFLFKDIYSQVDDIGMS